MTDIVKAHKRYGIELAIDFVKRFAQAMIENYEEPIRAGTKKGDRIGFSKKKVHVGLLCALYPNCLKLKEVAKMAGVSERVLLTWRAQKDFLEFMEKEHNLMGQSICHTIESVMHNEEIDLIGDKAVIIGSTLKILKSAREQFEDLIANLPEGVSKVIEVDDTRERKLKAKDPRETARTLVLILVSLNNSVSLPWVELLGKKLDESALGYPGLGLFTRQILKVHDEKTLRDWEKRPLMLDLTKKAIENDIDFLADSEVRKEFTIKEIKETAERAKEFIFSKLDILAS